MPRFTRILKYYDIYMGILLIITLGGIYGGFFSHSSTAYNKRALHHFKRHHTVGSDKTAHAGTLWDYPSQLLLPGLLGSDPWLSSPGKHNQIAMINCKGVLVNECEALRGLGYTIVNYSHRTHTVDALWTLDKRRTPPGLKVKAKTVNHIWGTRALCMKRDLLTAGNISVIPPAFIMPEQKEQFLIHAKRRLEKEPGVLWIQKEFRHRGVKITNILDILSNEKKGFLVQEYLAEPLLISNRKFDFGVFSIVTSVSPLRYYLYTADFMTQFCLVDYMPFDPTIHYKYLKRSQYAKVWEIPALKMLAGKPGVRKDIDIMYEYLDKEGYDSSKLHKDIVAAASEVGCKREKVIASIVEEKKKTTVSGHQKSFELLRFDVSVQRDLSVRVIEINMTPVTDAVDEHKGMFLKMLTSTMLMGGFENASWTEKEKTEYTDVNSVTDADINVDHDGCTECSLGMCAKKWTCSVCSLCLTLEDKMHFRRAVLEHRHQQDWTRVVPPPFKNQEAAREWDPMNDLLYQTLSRSTRIMTLWYHRKCLTDAAWCS